MYALTSIFPFCSLIVHLLPFFNSYIIFDLDRMLYYLQTFIEAHPTELKGIVSPYKLTGLLKVVKKKSFKNVK